MKKMNEIEDLHVKYRPSSFKDVLGHKEIVKSIKSVLKTGSGRTFLLTGPSGVGKTTLARIIAKEVRADSHNVLEVDAASHTGIDAMREITKMLSYSAFGESPSRIVIVDECHALSKAAWQSMLKSLEEPSPHVYWCLCTTEPSKVPATIKSRCNKYDLQRVPESDILYLLSTVNDNEEIKVNDEIIEAILDNCDGSPRQALVDLSKCRTAKTRKEALKLLAEPDAPENVVTLCRMILNGERDWKKISDIVGKIEEPPETIRCIICSYLASVALKKSNAEPIVQVLEHFSTPYHPAEKKAPLVRSLGAYVYGVE